MKIERLSVLLLVPAIVLYSFAFVTHFWFKLPGVSYGLWWAKFCSYLSCQIVPAFFTEEPIWYHVLQFLSEAGLLGMTVSLILLTSQSWDFGIPSSLNLRKQQAASVVCIASVFIISFTLLMFYGKLDESHQKASPQICCSAVMAGNGLPVTVWSRFTVNSGLITMEIVFAL